MLTLFLSAKSCLPCFSQHWSGRGRKDLHFHLGEANFTLEIDNEQYRTETCSKTGLLYVQFCALGASRRPSKKRDLVTKVGDILRHKRVQNRAKQNLLFVD